MRSPASEKRRKIKGQDLRESSNPQNVSMQLRSGGIRRTGVVRSPQWRLRGRPGIILEIGTFTPSQFSRLWSGFPEDSPRTCPAWTCQDRANGGQAFFSSHSVNCPVGRSYYWFNGILSQSFSFLSCHSSSDPDSSAQMSSKSPVNHLPLSY